MLCEWNKYIGCLSATASDLQGPDIHTSFLHPDFKVVCHILISDQAGMTFQYQSGFLVYCYIVVYR